MITIVIICCYLALLLGLGLFANLFLRSSSKDFFLASHSIGPFLLLMSLFGTTMTAFAMVGSTAQAYQFGIGTYGKIASASGLLHSAIFFFIGIKLWAIGKKYGIVTQCQYFRQRYESNGIGYLLFPILVTMVIPYLLVGLMGAGAFLRGATLGALPEVFPATNGAVPPWLTSAVICVVVLTYVFFGGLRAAAWANAFQTCVFMVVGLITFLVIAYQLGGPVNATSMANLDVLQREGNIGKLEFLTYFIIPFSVGMFPHLFQHWLTAKSAKTFRLPVIAHPLFIMIVWIPCILMGVWATGAMFNGERVIPEGAAPNAVLGIMVNTLTEPWVAGLVSAGVLAAIMSSLDSQFLCLGTMFTNDIVFHKYGEDRFTELQKIWMARGFIMAIVIITYILSLGNPAGVFQMGIWCFTGFASLFPLVFASVYWKGTTKTGAYACVIVTAVVWFLFFWDSGFGTDRKYLVFGMMPAAIIFTCSAVTIYVVSLFTARPSQETIKKFFAT